MTDEVLKPCPICWEQVKLQIDAREAFESLYQTHEPLIDVEIFALAPDGEYETALTRLCFKWFKAGYSAASAKDLK